MPIDYTDGENTTLTAEINKQQAYPAGFIDMAAPVDAMGERYRSVVEFDLSDSAAYTAIATAYSDAWDTYYGTGAAPAYSHENALKLQEAVKFWLYISDGETANVEAYASGGIISKDNDALVSQPRISPYTAESGSTYENPNVFYDQTTYDNVTTDGANPIPHVQMNGERAISSRKNASLYSAEQQAMKEYQITKAAPKSPYDWGSPYNTGGNTY